MYNSDAHTILLLIQEVKRLSVLIGAMSRRERQREQRYMGNAHIQDASVYVSKFVGSMSVSYAAHHLLPSLEFVKFNQNIIRDVIWELLQQIKSEPLRLVALSLQADFPTGKSFTFCATDKVNCLPTLIKFLAFRNGQRKFRLHRAHISLTELKRTFIGSFILFSLLHSIQPEIRLFQHGNVPHCYSLEIKGIKKI